MSTPWSNSPIEAEHLRSQHYSTGRVTEIIQSQIDPVEYGGAGRGRLLHGAQIGITESARLYEDLELDSLDIVEIAAELMDQFKIILWDDDVEKWQTAADIIDCAAARLESVA